LVGGNAGQHAGCAGDAVDIARELRWQACPTVADFAAQTNYVALCARPRNILHEYKY
jgi:hypothetical protein